MDSIRGRRILLDPLGGLYNDERVHQWLYEKKPVAGTQADVITSEIAATAYDLLRIVGADVFATRCMRRSHSEVGESGQPLFNECAGQYLRYCRMRPSLRTDKGDEHLPASVWGQGGAALEKDLNARVNFARHIKATAVICLDISHYATDEGLEVRHNGAEGAQDLAESILKEVAKRTRRKPKPVGDLLDEEQAYARIAAPVVVLNAGSSFDPFTARLLRNTWYRNLVSLGAFAGIWKFFVGASEELAIPCCK